MVASDVPPISTSSPPQPPPTPSKTANTVEPAIDSTEEDNDEPSIDPTDSPHHVEPSLYPTNKDNNEPSMDTTNGTNTVEPSLEITDKDTDEPPIYPINISTDKLNHQEIKLIKTTQQSLLSEDPKELKSHHNFYLSHLK